ncbi:hypothetical protein B0J12DRAFT_386406 [Macrophomina phaseolina]|uniref:Fork-head domain-containing protein n=1 Tax=Macrophomina phaseolina TaxID=35725 RepID=A0ABQ8FVI3_9PEZI|nr:hypothetical protein B0J12DRAFT_386406 [Macrophomina phaseolina]
MMARAESCLLLQTLDFLSNRNASLACALQPFWNLSTARPRICSSSATGLVLRSVSSLQLHSQSLQDAAPLPTQSHRIMTITDSFQAFPTSQFQVPPFRTNPPGPSLHPHVPVRQISTSAMQSPALLIPSKQAEFPPQTLGDHEHLLEVVGDPASGASNFSFLDYSYPNQSADFSSYHMAAPSQAPEPLAALNYTSSLRVAGHQPYADTCPGQFSSESDRSCPRTLPSFSASDFSGGYFPSGYQFPAPQQNFCVPDNIYQPPSPRMEEAFSGLSTKDDPQSMDTDVCPSPASQCLPYHGSSIYHHPDQEFNRGPHGERTDVVGNGQENVNMEKDEPYSKLIYRALMDTPGHTMVLRDIYQWFKVNTDKTDKETKGWQNSIRHNLSMNGAFDKVEQAPGEDTKKGNMWRLTEEAIREGVKSTTRYRKPHSKRGAKNPHGQFHHPPAAQRQAAGSKGGQAARRQTQRQQQKHEQQEQQQQQPQLLQQRISERGLFESGLCMAPERPLNPETEPCDTQYMLGPITGEPHVLFGHRHGLPNSNDFLQHLSTHPSQYHQLQPSEPGSTSHSPIDLIDCPSFPQSPTQDQSWAFNTISDTSVLFTPANGLFGGEPLGVTEFGLTPSESPSLSDADGPPTPTHNPGGLDVDPDGHLAPPAPTNFYEAEGRI